MVITDELFELRSEILSASIKEAGIRNDLRKERLDTNRGLKRALVKTSEADVQSLIPINLFLIF